MTVAKAPVKKAATKQPQAAPEVWATLYLASGKSIRIKIAMSGDPLSGLGMLLQSPMLQTERGFVNSSLVERAELDAEG